jgi:hypothetical protein
MEGMGMRDTKHEGGAIDTGRATTGVDKRDWRAPKLTPLGDANTLTQAVTGSGADSALLSS